MSMGKEMLERSLCSQFVMSLDRGILSDHDSRMDDGWSTSSRNSFIMILLT
jgi:hypothetical protein